MFQRMYQYCKLSIDALIYVLMNHNASIFTVTFIFAENDEKSFIHWEYFGFILEILYHCLIISVAMYCGIMTLLV